MWRDTWQIEIALGKFKRFVLFGPPPVLRGMGGGVVRMYGLPEFPEIPYVKK